MKRTMMALGAAMTLLAGAASAQMMGPGMGAGMHRGNPFARDFSAPPLVSAGPMMLGCYRQLELTEAQRAQILAIERELFRTQSDLMAQMRVVHTQNPGHGMSAEELELMQELRAEMIAAAQDAMARINAVLTPEQRQRVAQGCRP